MNIAVIGSGYVGLTTGTCLAEIGHSVTCIDRDEDRIALLHAEQIPIYEPGLETLVSANVELGRLTFTTDLASGVQDADAVFIAVGTPEDGCGNVDLSAVYAVANQLTAIVNPGSVIVTKSTVPPGTGDRIQRIFAEAGLSQSVASNPEFLREGSAINDFLQPDRIVIGCNDRRGVRVLSSIYQPLTREGFQLVVTGRREAELIKYVANSFLATKISFINEIANLCDSLDLDVDDIRRGIGFDHRIGFEFLRPGCGYGGSCFPKDVQGLYNFAQTIDVNLSIIGATHDVNVKQRLRVAERVLERLGENLFGKKIGIWGAAFKKGTDDIREAPAVLTIARLLEAGAQITVHDPEALDNLKSHFGSLIQYADNTSECTRSADALLIMTDWDEYSADSLKNAVVEMNSPLVFDGRNLLDIDMLQKESIEYYGIGRRTKIDCSPATTGTSMPMIEAIRDNTESANVTQRTNKYSGFVIRPFTSAIHRAF
ncbi:MAG: UDP-glucose dehydrogenase family protein [Phycisphaerae bacterium]